MSKRAIRRHHQDRILAKTRRLLRIWRFEPESIERYVYRRANNFSYCSCWGCGNPRRHYSGSYKLTRQEVVANFDLGEEI